MEIIKDKDGFPPERLVYFSDAVVAIAITLLILDLRFEKGEEELSFENLWHLRREFVSFLLSFILISVFWRVHYQFFNYIRKVDTRLIFYNSWWLLCIVLIPFSTTLVSGYFLQKTSVLVYCINSLVLSVLQNQIWDYVALRPEYLNGRQDDNIVRIYRIDCNVAMINNVLATILALFIPPVSLVMLALNRPLIMLFRRIYRKKD